MKTLFALVAVVVLLAALKAASSIVVPLLLAVTIAVGFQPISRRLAAYGAPPIVASVVTILAVLAVLAGLGYLVVLASTELVVSAPKYGEQLAQLRDRLDGWLDARGLARIGASLQDMDVGGAAGGVVTSAVVMVSGIVGDLLNILILTAFIQVEAQLMERKLELILPQKSVDRTVAAIGEVQKYLRVKFLLAAMNGVILGTWCWLWGVSNPLLWGVTAFAFNFVPVIGSLISAVPPLIFALLEHGVGTTLGVGAGYVAVNILVDNVLEARLMGRAMGISPLVLMVSLLVWGFVLGPVGALLSVPLTVAVRIYLEYHQGTRWVALLLADGTKGYQDLKERPAPLARDGDEPPAAAT